MNILIIEDNEILALKVREAFLKTSFTNRVGIFSSYIEYLQGFQTIFVYDLILLDMDLGKEYKEAGLQIISHVREKDKKLPIVVMSSHDSYGLLQESFTRGANDYIIKPFRQKELEIRIQRWFYNYIFLEYYTITKSIDYYELCYYIKKDIFYIGDKELRLSRGNKYLLSLFFIYREQLLTNSFLKEKIWGFSDHDQEKNLRIKILRLKNKLKEFEIQDWIENVYGQGFIFQKYSQKH